ncbi:DUF3969 family protein [Wukongibacter sp. M2B1]|uniref:DUF3969 family protein n=1 Tax=Wukongibacter sp. M2B1 TaxID=3088895 RepID=UPI003D79693F
MHISMNISGKDEIEKMVGIILLGLLTAVEEKVISIDDSEDYLFNPYTSRIFSELGLNNKIIKVIEEGWELDALRILNPISFDKEILKFKKEIIELLKQMPSSKSSKKELITEYKLE